MSTYYGDVVSQIRRGVPVAMRVDLNRNEYDFDLLTQHNQ